MKTFPAMPSCNGCGDCCGPVSARPKEIARIKRYIAETGVEWTPPPDSDPLRCGFLRDAGDAKTCAVYPVRPWACRAFGVIASMPCEHFPEDATIVADISATDAVHQGLIAPTDRLLGDVFERGYYGRLQRLINAAELLPVVRRS